jgi:hypothetical protein
MIAVESPAMATIDEALNELTAVAPRDFVKARDTVASRLRKEGAGDAAKSVAAMKRPPVSVWVVNRLAREAKDTIAALIDASDRVKDAQLNGRAPSGLSAATARQRAVLAELMRRAEAFLRDAGVHSSAELVRRIETTLMAGATDKENREALRKGRLEQDLEALGFDVFVGAPLPPRGEPSAAPAPIAQERRQAHQLAAARAEPAMGSARESERKRVELERERKRAQDAARDAEKRAEALAHIEKLRTELSAATERVREAKRHLQESMEAVRAASRSEEAAKRALAHAMQEAGARGARK